MACGRSSQVAGWSRLQKGAWINAGTQAERGFEKHSRLRAPSVGSPESSAPYISRGSQDRQPDAPCDEPNLPAPNPRLCQVSQPLNRPEPIFRNRHVSNPNGLIHPALLQQQRAEVKSSSSASGFGNYYAI